MSDHGYRPGHCNIGPRGRRRRALLAGGAFLGAALYAAACLTGLLPRPLLVAVFLPLGVGFEWGLQAYDRFCVRLALLGRYAVGGENGAVDDAVDRRADRLQAAKLTAVAIALAAITTVAVLLLA